MDYIKIEDFNGHRPSMRYGSRVSSHKGIEYVISKNRSHYDSLLREFSKLVPVLKKLSFDFMNSDIPYWNNGFIPFLDVLSLMGFLSNRSIKRFIEIGSGNSTVMAHFIREELSLDFEIISIDPKPRLKIDRLCDRVIRKNLEDIDLRIFDDLGEGDILYFDGSHRVLQNSDNQILFFEIIPSAQAGVLFHIHDINWPNDYPEEWKDRYYSEQYVLGSALLYSGESIEILFPSAYISNSHDFNDLYSELWNRDGFQCIPRYGNSFWFKIASRSEAFERCRLIR